MKKTNAKKKLLPAVGMLAISAAMLSSATFAWFTMNKEVTVTGMSVHTTVGSNLLISATNTEGSYTKDLTQTLANVHLEPVSTIDGIDYFYTVEADDAGKKFGTATTAPNYVAYDPSSLTAFNTAYGVDDTHTAVGYIDYQFYLKATEGDTAEKLSMNKCNLLYNGAAVTEKAWRAAVFVDEVDLGDTYTVSGSDLTTILPISGATYFTTTSGKPQGVDATNALGDVSNYGEKAIVDSAVTANSTKYYAVVVRLWIEGEDDTCTAATFADLTDNYSLDLQFYLDGTHDGTQIIDSDTTFSVPVA